MMEAEQISEGLNADADQAADLHHDQANPDEATVHVRSSNAGIVLSGEDIDSYEYANLEMIDQIDRSEQDIGSYEYTSVGMNDKEFDDSDSDEDASTNENSDE